MFNLKGRIGGDSDLSAHGHKVWNIRFLILNYLSTRT